MNHFDAQEVIAEQEEIIEKQARLIKELSSIAEQNELVEEVSDRENAGKILLSNKGIS